jgi:transcriptional regulator of acetoin/glycerol metabolism
LFYLHIQEPEKEEQNLTLSTSKFEIHLKRHKAMGEIGNDALTDIYGLG